MNALATVVVVSAVLLSAVNQVRSQVDRGDNKYLDPNDFFLSGRDIEDRRRIQDAFNRYAYNS